jgi:hypothetical protein
MLPVAVLGVGVRMPLARERVADTRCGEDVRVARAHPGRRRRAMAPFLGGMRGLTVFVQDVRNCANKVRDDDATASARERCE